jgi:hypothetical protein
VPSASTVPASTPPVTPPTIPTYAPLHKVHDPLQVTGTLAGHCTFRGTVTPDELPDPACTPGAYDPAITAAVLCAPGYRTSTYRAPESQTSRFKYNVAYPAYGVPSTTATELDHLISLELGGANDASNLWPEAPLTPNPKDLVENALHDWVCAVTGTAAQARLAAAQIAIAGDWLTAEHVLGIRITHAQATHAPPAIHTASATHAPPAAHTASAACAPLTSSGHCYEPGEFCRSADHGMRGVAGDGKAIVCESSSGWRWVSV